MAQELIYTSVPKGLKAGSDGYCTVAYTDGMPANGVRLLESLSDYSFLNLDDPDLDSSPVSYRHYRHAIGTQRVNILSRVAFCGFDYTKRSNKFAHHVVLIPEERSEAGPAWLCIQKEKSLFLSEWNKGPELIKNQKTIPTGMDFLNSELAVWKELSGDAGWGGKLAESFLEDPSKPSYIVYDIKDGSKMIHLIREALLLLPPEKRWEVTFNTYFTGIRGTECAWRCCLKGAPALSKARGTRGTLIIDLTEELPDAEGGKLVSAARNGVIPDDQKRSDPFIKPAPAVAQGEGKISIFSDRAMTENLAVADGTSATPLKEDPKIDIKGNSMAVPAISAPAKEAEPSIDFSQKKRTETSPLPEVKDKQNKVEKNQNSQPAITQTNSGKNPYLLVILAGGLIIIILLIIILLLLVKQDTNKQKGNEDKQPANTDSGNEKIEKPDPGIKEKGPENPIPKEKVETDPIIETPIPINEKKEPEVEENPTLPPTVEKEPTKPPVESISIWEAYQRGIKNIDNSPLEIPLPIAGKDSEIKLAWEFTKKKELEALGLDPEKKEKGKVTVLTLKSAGIDPIPEVLCEFRLDVNREIPHLVISKSVENKSTQIDLAKDIEAISIDSRSLPLTYSGEAPLKQGEGNLQLPDSNGKLVGKAQYSFSENDLLAGILNTKKYFFSINHKKRKLDSKPEYSDGKLRCELLLPENFPGIASLKQKSLDAANQSLSKNKKIITDYLKDKLSYKNPQLTNKNIEDYKIIIEKAKKDEKREAELNNPFFPVRELGKEINMVLQKVQKQKVPFKGHLTKQLNGLRNSLGKFEKDIAENDKESLSKDRFKLKEIKIPSGENGNRKLPERMRRMLEDINGMVDECNPVMIKRKLEKNPINRGPLPAEKALKAITEHQRITSNLKDKDKLFWQYLNSNQEQKDIYKKEIESIEQYFSITVKRNKDGKTVKIIEF